MNNYLTTKQLQQQIINLGFELESTESIVLVKDDLNRKVASIRINEMYAFDTVWGSFCELDTDVQKQLYNLSNRYACTPLDKRVREKKYQLRLKISNEISIFDGDYGDYYCLVKTSNGKYCLSLPTLSQKGYQNTFTQSEIDEMGDITEGFVKEEVY